MIKADKSFATRAHERIQPTYILLRTLFQSFGELFLGRHIESQPQQCSVMNFCSGHVFEH
jgi:hypothetical protein